MIAGSLKPFAFNSLRNFSTQVSSQSILSSALPLVPQHGWKDALVESCRSLNMSDQASSLFTPDDLIKFHYNEQLQKLKTYESNAPAGFPRLKELMLYRLLEGNKSLGNGRLAEAISIATSTGPISTGFKCLSEVSDELWYLAGDRSTDTTWYTRRGSLSAVYAASELFQSRDNSVNHRDTKAVVTKLLAKLETVEYAEKSTAEWLDFNIRGAFNVLRTWA